MIADQYAKAYIFLKNMAHKAFMSLTTDRMDI